ncbi:LOW QUALITY PROTEIN: apolipoprotein A-Ib [Chelmon rostratus]|uniref:LOW QUALITY PROTEIN: apolipoprotein A-Ib n=1 Tax=Chelmon rostratus TaxID=109905 RepID=UPI001BEB374D|nr:LOW QUALITY PROTEIN: apolipoprotein A-Ib [Chelmon rostratus]
MDSSLTRHYKKSALAEVVQSCQELHQTTIMKFAVLALALLLAVGSQAASLQADAPSQLAQIRSAVDVYMTQVKDGAKRALDQLDDTEYSQLKAEIVQHLDDVHNQIKSLQSAISPMTDSVIGTLADATSDVRASLVNDVDTMRTDLQEKRAALETVIAKHVEEYRKQIEPFVQEQMTRHRAQMEELKTRLEPFMEELRGKIATNVEETKTALMPIVEAVKAKITERVENVRAMAAPYVQEYQEQARSAYAQAKTMDASKLTDMQAKIAPLAEDIKAKLQSMFEIILSNINTN